MLPWLTSMAPIYMQSYTVDSSVKSLAEIADIREKEEGEIVSLLQTRLDINNVKIVKAAEAEFAYEEGVATIKLEYEVRRPYMGNIDAVLKFKHSAELGGR